MNDPVVVVTTLLEGALLVALIAILAFLVDARVRRHERAHGARSDRKGVQQHA